MNKNKIKNIPDWSNVKWRNLKHNEIIRKGDWVDMCRDGMKDNPVWKPATCIGKKAPDSSYPAHRIYRRLISK